MKVKRVYSDINSDYVSTHLMKLYLTDLPNRSSSSGRINVTMNRKVHENVRNTVCFKISSQHVLVIIMEAQEKTSEVAKLLS
jgi:hypothetical protein